MTLSIDFTVTKNVAMKMNFVIEVLDAQKSHVFESYNIPINGILMSMKSEREDRSMVKNQASQDISM